MSARKTKTKPGDDRAVKRRSALIAGVAAVVLPWILNDPARELRMWWTGGRWAPVRAEVLQVEKYLWLVHERRAYESTYEWRIGEKADVAYAFTYEGIARTGRFGINGGDAPAASQPLTVKVNPGRPWESHPDPRSQWDGPLWALFGLLTAAWFFWIAWTGRVEKLEPSDDRA
jgi:hypothetical protein